jgi:hypothetical protein
LPSNSWVQSLVLQKMVITLAEYPVCNIEGPCTIAAETDTSDTHTHTEREREREIFR